MKKLEILTAYYGVLDDVMVDVTEKLQELVRDERLTLPGGYFSYNDLFGDPAPNRHKQLRVKYRVSEAVDLSGTWVAWRTGRDSFVASGDEVVVFEEDEALEIPIDVSQRDGYFYNGEDPIKLEDL